MAGKIFGSSLSAEMFLKNYWQKKPLLFKGAFPDFQDPLSPDELAGISMQEGVHARIVREKQGRKSWTLAKGPFDEELLRNMPEKDWTLLVSNLEQWADGAASILDHFPFIPHWRCDDLMASFAPVGGSVGPHTDSYDVFLIQGMGRRRWQIAEKYRPEIIDGVDLKVLKSFKSESEWVLESGDMLYLPPGVAHYGVALENCMTYSVGFRAPTVRMLAGNLLNISDSVLADSLATETLFQDPDLKLQSCPGEITAASVESIRTLLEPVLNDPKLLSRWFGTFMSFPNPGQPAFIPPKKRQTETLILAGLNKGKVIVRSDNIRTYYAQVGTRVAVFAGGQEHLADKSWLPFIKAISSARYCAAVKVLKTLPKTFGAGKKNDVSLVEWLFQHGAIYFD